MNLFPPISKTSCKRVHQHLDGTRKVTIQDNNVTITVTFNTPSQDAIERFTNAFHTILLHMTDEVDTPTDTDKPPPLS